MIAAGRVAVNGQIVTTPGTRVGPQDRLAVDGRTISRATSHTYVMLNKPVGYVSTARDERGRRTVLDLIQTPHRIYPVGRLDLDSEGLLLLTNDGELTFRVLHPRHELPREYHVWVTSTPSEDQLNRLRQGVEIEGWRTGSAQVSRRPGGSLSMTIHEGHKRQVRLMCQAVGLDVSRLLRARLGPLSLGSLKPGEWRELRPTELAALRRAVGLDPTATGRADRG
jgi:pseudouridine synthase